jgi:tetratricopeptide (TPR) repeat protein
LTRSGILLAALTLVAGTCLAAPSPRGEPEPAYLAMARGEACFAREELREARAAYLTVLETEPNHLEALCRLTRVEAELGERATGSERAKLKQAAVRHARQAVRVAPDSSRAHVWLAVALGSQALHEPFYNQLPLAREMKTELDRAIALDGRNDRAYHLRGLLVRRVSTLNLVERTAVYVLLGGVPAGATLENALGDFERAAQLDPRYVDHQLELGRTLMMMRRYPEARLALERATALPPRSSTRDRGYQREARSLLERMPREG